MKNRLLPLLLLAALCGAATPMATAQDAGLKQRMEQRLSSVDDLRRRQIVGENNAGFLELRGPANPQEQELVAAENLDRAAVYAAIAKRNETTKETVGKARAKQIATASAKGLLLQDAEGNWAPKP
jgi:uncharacterized protein YdbL (DUF1318 family)